MEKKEPIPKEHNHKETADFARSRLPSEDDLFELAELFKNLFGQHAYPYYVCFIRNGNVCL